MRKSYFLFIAAVTLAASLAPLHAQILLTVDETNPSAITITATNADPSASSSTYDVGNGIDLLGFFSSNNDNGGSGSTTLLANGTSFSLNGWFGDNESTSGGAALDLNLYSQSSGQTMNFVTTSPAFTGTLTINLSAYTSELPSPGSIGVLDAGSNFGGDGVTPIGFYQIIAAPEPATYAELGIGLLVLLAAGRFRRLRI